MSNKRKKQKRGKIVRYASLDNVPLPKRLNRRLIEMTDAEVERRAAADPDAGVIPPGFWDNAEVLLPETKQSPMGVVLRSYVEAKEKRA